MLSLLFWLLACICHALMEKFITHHSKSIFRNAKSFSFFGSNSWTRKYKDHNPQAGTAFWGSTTFLVWVTDGYHLIQWMMLWFLAGAVVTLDVPMEGVEAWIAVILVFRISWTLVFKLFYEVLLAKK